MTKEIILTRGKVAIVDDDDFEELSRHKWRYKYGYAVRNAPTSTNKYHLILMHREIINTPDGMQTDHVNGDMLDNRRNNLRVCTHAENMRNAKKHKNNTSGYKGVAWHRTAKKWRAFIWSGKHRHLGLFERIEDAATAYNIAAYIYHGEFARYNVPLGIHP